MSGDVRIGMIGAGMVGQLAHLSNFVRTPGCRVTALAELRPELGKAAMDTFGVPKLYPSHHEMLAANEIDAAVVVTRRPATGPVVLDVLEAGKHVLSEKPMAHTSEQGAQLVKAAAERQLVYSVGYMKRHDEGTAVAKKLLDELVASNELGRIILMRGYCFCGDFNVHPEGFVMTPEARPDGLTLWPSAPDWLPPQYAEDYAWFLNVFVHDLNILRYLTRHDLTVRSVDLSRRNGRVAVFDAGAFPVVLEMGEQAGTEWTEGVDIQFEKGRLTIQFPSPLIENKSATVTLTRGKDARVLDTGASWSFRRQAEAFVADIAGHRNPIASGADSLKDLDLVERIWRVYLGLN